MRFLLTILFLHFSHVYSQGNEPCKLIVARWKLNRNKSYYFKDGMYTSMKIKDSVYIIPQIEKISWDSITIKKRIYYDDTHIEWVTFTFPIEDMKWINWDGIPRKKVRARFYRFEVEERSGLYCQ